MTPKQLMLEAADDLERLDTGNGIFDMSNWGYHTRDHSPEEKNYCGTSACAAGWLAMQPKWRERGFTAEWEQYEGEWDLLPDGSSSHGAWKRMTLKVFGGEAGEMIWHTFITFNKAATKEEVAAFIRRMVEVHDWEES